MRPWQHYQMLSSSSVVFFFLINSLCFWADVDLNNVGVMTLLNLSSFYVRTTVWVR